MDRIPPAGSALVQAFMIVGLTTPFVAAQPAKVVVAGGADPSGQNYEWTITNHHPSPLVFIEFSHFHADTFTAPAGWKKEITNPSIAGADESKGGLCRATAESPSSGISTGGSAAFGLRLARIGAPKGRGTMTVRFADGVSFAVTGVSLPVPPSSWERIGTVLLLGGAFVAFLIFRIRKRPKSSAT
jgi:hypothetical protein